MLHYQPIVSLQSGAVSHYEALIRLADDPDETLTPPCAFLPAAERYGLIQEIDRVVIGKVVALMGGELAEQRRTRRCQPVGPLDHRPRHARPHRARTGPSLRSTPSDW